jgi:uncharacterized heparinase superfamily protein
MEHQVRADGCDHEASTSYHRLVTELFLRATEAASALGHSFPDWYRERLERMTGFIRDYTRPDGLAPLIGDADDGRFLPLGDYARDPRDHRGLAAEPGTTSAAYPDGGYYVLRNGDVFLIVRCGDTGLYGLGGHSHNDQLAFELCAGDQPLVVDPGAYLYTADPVARNEFRSTSFHATLRVDGQEQNELGSDYLFHMPDRTRAESLGFDERSFEGRHHGFPGAPHTRRIELADGGVVVTDEVPGEHDLEWTFPLMPGCSVEVSGERATAMWDSMTLEIEARGLVFAVEPGWYSPRYGIRVEAPFVRARARRSGMTELKLTLK